MDAREIKICDETGSDSGADIVICNDQGSDTPREIVVCADCENVSELQLIGDDEPSVGDTYGGSGGRPPYIYSFSGGNIDRNTGEILGITACGDPGNNGAVATVTVSDQCGQSAQLQVRLPGGSWTLTGEDCENNPCDEPSGIYESIGTCSIISGGQKDVYYYHFSSISSPYGYSCANEAWACCSYCTWRDIAVCNVTGISGSQQFKRILHYKTEHYSWEC